MPVENTAANPVISDSAHSIGGLLALVMVVLGGFDEIIRYFIFVVVIFIALTVMALFVLRRDPSPGGYRVPAYPFTPIVFLVLTAVLLCLLAGHSPWKSLLGIAVVLLGIPVYYFFFRVNVAA